jgi:DNA-binding Lrp family transcriptional regulator
MINLKPTDTKLLAYLYSNARAPATEIAKKLHLSREQVSYRIEKFQQEGIIKGYIPLVSYSRLGYHLISLFLLKFTNQSEIKEFKQFIKNDKNRIITVETLTNFDLGMLLIFKNEKERNEYFSKLLEKYYSQIHNYLILEPYFSEFYPLKFLNIKNPQTQIFHEYKQREYKLDEKEIKILKILNKKGNSRIIDIAKSTNLSAELIVYKLKSLAREKVILGTRAYFDMEKIGYFYTLMLLHVYNFSKQNQEKLRNFAKENKKVDSLMFLFGKPNCYMQLFHKSIRDIHTTIEKLKNTFNNEPLEIEIVPLKNEGEDMNTLPML